ncbi:DUF6766 family protein [Streptomyces hydrogenans]|uniref:DUF6766 family protein n=1 Tax=Streptomyces hydrogenans TaxID=1873719 RepID=UPI00167D959E|nr:DUF6766 family protein [Streptomyces hydrogenans]GHE27624.1 hypothetical protein GCM10018784_77060 [Streptomyces hydrogenans]
MVRLRGDALFLSQFDAGWKVVAAGCTPRPDMPFDCKPESARDQRVDEHAREDSPRWAGARDRRQNLYSRSLGVVTALLFVLSWLAQSISGAACNAEQQRDLSEPVSWAAYPASAHFWNRTLQNWQSELLAVAAMVVLSIYLRQRGSPESKPVGAPHSATGAEG